MTDAEETASQGRIEAGRRVIRKAAALCMARGASVEEVAISAAYASFDLAEHHAGPGVAAIEWKRSSLDVMEAALMRGEGERCDEF